MAVQRKRGRCDNRRTRPTPHRHFCRRLLRDGAIAAAARSRPKAEEEQPAREAGEHERREREKRARQKADIEARQGLEAARRAERQRRTKSGINPAITMPLAESVLCIVLDATDAWNSLVLGSCYTVPPLVVASLYAFLFRHYGAADLSKSLLAGAILWAVPSALVLEATSIVRPPVLSLSR